MPSPVPRYNEDRVILKWTTKTLISLRCHVIISLTNTDITLHFRLAFAFVNVFNSVYYITNSQCLSLTTRHDALLLYEWLLQCMPCCRCHPLYQISAAALYRPTALNHSPVHHTLVYHAPAYLSPSIVSLASCWAATIYYAHTIAGLSVLASSPLTWN